MEETYIYEKGVVLMETHCSFQNITLESKFISIKEIVGS